jgi:hypothetical protein
MTDKEINQLLYLITGVEDGWIAVNKEAWQKYLKAKELIKNVSKRNN